MTRGFQCKSRRRKDLRAKGRNQWTCHSYIHRRSVVESFEQLHIYLVDFLNAKTGLEGLKIPRMSELNSKFGGGAMPRIP